MRICFDLRALQIGHENRGIGMFIKSVLEHLPPGDNEYVFYAFDKTDPIKELGIRFQYDYQLIQTPTLKTAIGAPVDIVNFLRLIWHSFRALKPTKPDVFVQFDFQLGLPRWRKTKTLVIAYDLIPLIKKNQYLPGFRFAWQHSAGKKAKLRAVVRSAYYRLKYGLSYRVYKRADNIVSISETTAKSFTQLLGIAEQKIRTLHLAPVISETKSGHSSVKKINKPYVFYVGGTDSRKRIGDLIYAFNIVRGRGANMALVLAGNEFKAVKELPDIVARNVILESPYRNDIHLIGFVTDSQKKALYQSAYAFVFCSAYEGFGLPIVEAMSASCPVISYNNSSIPETAGDAALLVDTGDYVGIANALLSLQDETLRNKLIKKGLGQAGKFNWDRFAKEFLQILAS